MISLLKILLRQSQSQPWTQTPMPETPAPLTLLNLTVQSQMKEVSMTQAVTNKGLTEIFPHKKVTT